MTTAELLEATLKSPEAMWELRGVARALLAVGRERQEIVDELMAFKEALLDQDPDQDVDVINDVLADLTGYCSIHMRI